MNNSQDMPSSPSRIQSVAIPAAIVFGFALIAIAIYFSGGSNPIAAITGSNNESTGETGETSDPDLNLINPVTGEDHIRGNPNAPIVFVEYSDFDCPFCKNFHETMKRIMEEYGSNGQVAWVYRQFPLQQLHPSAPRIAEASECVAKLGGNQAFWTFSDLIFEERAVNEPTDMSRLNEFATTAGVNETAFAACLESGETRELVEEDFNNAVAIGGRGTPHTIVLVGDQQGVINGAQPYATVQQIVENLLAQNDDGALESE